jgi:2-oxoglutarate dehydrogenase E1 component
VTFACKLAIEYRQSFKRDIVIDMWCYRRFGHNEGDEPSFTQPLMYREIRKHPAISDIYAARLPRKACRRRLGRGVISQFTALLEGEFEAAKTYLPNKADWFEGRWSGPRQARHAGNRAAQRQHRDGEDVLRESAGRSPHSAELDRPQDAAAIIDAKRQMFESGEGFDWATAEALAFGTLLKEGFGVRLPGQDSGRGTFSHRHAVWVDQKTAQKYIPLTHIEGGRFEVRDSPASANSECSASNMAIRPPIRAASCCGKRSSAISPTARR